MIPSETSGPPATNAPELTVSDLSSALKRTIEDAFGHVRLRGEISGYRGPHSSGHVYFSLKDQNARIDAVIWKGSFAKMRFKPEEGMEVIATGRITTFAGKSSYQIIVEALEPAGVGALMALLEERRRKLAAEGLFDTARKRKIPYLPEVIGVVTSPTGAVIRDILHRLEDRFPRRVLVWPVRVQGETSAAEIAAAIDGFNALSQGGKIPRPDVLIVARGGGSIEDLWSFNEEIVVRAAAASTIPLISAVGHETDWTLIDHVADLRAPTPTGAAEMAVPVRSDLLAAVNGLARRHEEAMARSVERLRTELRSVSRALPGRDELFAVQRQRLDLASARLTPALRSNARTFENRFFTASQRLARLTPRARLAAMRARFDASAIRPTEAVARLLKQRARDLETVSARLNAARQGLLRNEKERLVQRNVRVDETLIRLRQAANLLIERKASRLTSAGALFDSLNYKSVLKRGYAVVRRTGGDPVRLASEVTPGLGLTIEFADGAVEAVANGDGGGGGQRTPRKKDPPAKTPQTSLFD